jgi:hypothetical protein
VSLASQPLTVRSPKPPDTAVAIDVVVVRIRVYNNNNKNNNKNTATQQHSKTTTTTPPKGTLVPFRSLASSRTLPLRIYLPFDTDVFTFHSLDQASVQALY